MRAWGAARDRVALDGGDTRDVLHGHLRRRLCVRQAEKVLNKFTLFGSAASKNEAAAELFQKAGNAYKMAKKCKPAVHACRHGIHLILRGRECARAGLHSQG